MKSLPPNFQRSKRIVSIGLLVPIAGILLLVPTVRAGDIPNPPKWIRFELDAISLYRTAMNQENSDPQAAVNTLRQARQASTAAIANGGGANQAVMYNDALIGHALMLDQTDAARTPENTKSPETQSPKTGGIKVIRPVANHIQVTLKRSLR